jgi:Holliday junction resolvase
MNRNYKKGRDKEYRLKRKYEKLGCICIRSAGSHSFIDIIAIHPRSHHIYFIQSKPRKFSKRAKAKLEYKFEWLSDEFICKFQVE